MRSPHLPDLGCVRETMCEEGRRGELRLSQFHLRTGVSRTVAASQSNGRAIRLSRRVIPPFRSVSPDACFRAVKPNCAPSKGDFLQRFGSSTAVRNARAVTGPIPGTLTLGESCGVVALPPETHGFVAHVDASFVEEVFDVPERKREANLEHHRRADDFRARSENLNGSPLGMWHGYGADQSASSQVVLA